MPAKLGALVNDYKVVDDLQSIMLQSKTLGGIVNVAIDQADAQDLTQHEVIASGGVFQSGDRVFRLGANQIPSGIQPKAGDALTDAASITWELLDAALDDFGISWECTARKAR